MSRAVAAPSLQRRGRRIDHIEVVPLRVPRRGLFRLQRGPSGADSPHAVVVVHDEAGGAGFGECVTRMASLYRVLEDHLLERLLGLDPFDLVGLHEAVDGVETLVTERRGSWNPVRAAVEMACYDLQGRTLGVPLYALLGGARRAWVPVVKNVGVATAEESARLAGQLAAAGHRVLKLRVGGDDALDVARCAAVREAVGPDVALRVDVNEAWAPRRARAMLERLAPVGLEAVEQPCDAADLAGAAEVVAASHVPVICDEGFWTPQEARAVLQARAADVLHAYLGKCGGIRPTLACAALAESSGCQLTLGERVPLGISEAAHLHVAATLRRLDFPCALAYDLNEHDLLATPIERRPGMTRVPDAPGLGVEVDLEALERYRRAD